MPIKHAIWKVAEQPQPLSTSALVSEQEITPYAGRIDLLAIAPDGSLILIELKRNRTPREIVAQAIDYAAWVESLSADKIAQIYQRFSGGGNLDEAFRQHFGVPLDEETLNQSHQIILVAAELDNASERIINYLNARDIAINVLFFQVFQNGSEQFLSRAWLIDPGETQSNVVATTTAKTGEKEPWNGEFYASYGPPELRSWDDARQYGFISAGRGTWYSKTLKKLSPGDRVWVNIPQTGYVGVGRVVESVQPASEFRVSTSGCERSINEVLSNPEQFKYVGDPEMQEYYVRIRWIDTVPVEAAFNETGLFGNQNTVCQPNTTKWRHTIERLKTKFSDWNADER